MKLIQLRNIFIYLFLVSFFFFPRMQTLFISSAFFITFFTGEFRQFKELVLKNKIGISIILFFSFTLISLLWTSNIEQGLKGIEIKFSMLAFPIFLPLIFGSSNINLQTVIKVLFASAFVYAVFSFSRAFYLFTISQDSTVFFSSKLGFRVNPEGSPFVHPTYVSFYYLVLLLVLGKQLIDQTTSVFSRYSLVKIGLSLVFLLFIMMSYSKAGILGLGIIVLVLTSYFAVKKKKVVQAIVMFFGFTIISAAGIYNSSLKLKFAQAYQEITKQNGNPGSYLMSTGARIWIWKATAEIIKENPIIGVGTGDIRDELTAKYKEIGITTIQDTGFDSHQQYLQIFAALGVLGLFSLLAIFFYLFNQSIKTKNLILIGFSGLYFFFGFTESMLETQAGIIFFVFGALFFQFYSSSKRVSYE